MKKAALLFAAGFLAATSFAAPVFTGLSSNGGNVNVSPITTEPAVSGTDNFGATAGETHFEWVSVGHVYRIRQTGGVTRFKMYLGATTGLSGLTFKVWRQNANGTYALVGSSEKFTSFSASSVNTFTLASPISAQVGDYVGVHAEYTSASAYNFHTSSATQAIVGWQSYPMTYPYEDVETYYIANATATTNYDWAVESSTQNMVVRVEAEMNAPVFVAVGDSITSGAVTNYSFIDTLSDQTVVSNSYPYQFSQASGYSYQNMGFSGETSAQTLARFSTDVVALNPKFVLIMVGINDINSSVSTTTIVSNIASMVSASTAAGIIPVVLSVTPEAPHASVTYWRQIDALNQALFTLMKNPAYNGAFVYNDSLGQYYSGDAGNLWQLQAAYASADNVHLSPTGYAYLASNAAVQLGISPNTSSTSGTGGTSTTDGLYTVVTFTTDGTFTVSGDSVLPVEYLLIGGGGAGAGWWGGGGAAGGVLHGFTSLAPGTYPVTIGQGGIGGTTTGEPNGSTGTASTFNSLTADGGGYGAYASDGGDGGSGGGGGAEGAISHPGGSATQGYAGGQSGTSSGGYQGGGGGGPSGQGQNATGSKGGDGGLGFWSFITGTSSAYAGGGGAGIRTGTPGYGGSGVGGDGGVGDGGSNPGDPGAANTGSGGGGGGGSGGGPTQSGGDGADGILVLRFLTPASSSVGKSVGGGFFGVSVGAATTSGVGFVQ